MHIHITCIVMCIYIVHVYTCVIEYWLGSSRRSGCGLEWAWPNVVLALLPHVYISIDVTSEREGGRGLRECVFEGEGRSVCVFEGEGRSVCVFEGEGVFEREGSVCQGRGHSKQYLQLPHTHTQMIIQSDHTVITDTNSEWSGIQLQWGQGM